MNALAKITRLASSCTLALVAMSASAGCSTPPSDREAMSSSSEALVVGSRPSGEYSGGGTCVDPASGSGPYRAAYSVSASSIELRYSWGPERSDFLVKLALAWTTSSEFTFTVDGDDRKAGSG